MKLYIWHRADEVTNCWHEEAGIVVLAETLEQAMERATLACFPKPRSEPLPPPDLVHDLSVPDCWVFPDSGCC